MLAPHLLSSPSPVVVPAGIPIGRPFQPCGEAEVIPGLVAAALARARKDRRLILLSELRGPFGVPDFVILETDDQTLTARMESGVSPLLNQIDAAIVGSLGAKRPRRLSSVARDLGWPERHLAPRANELCRSGVISQVQPGSFIRLAALKPLGHLAVYEAKVDKWRRGLLQASTYATWADSATLAIARLPRDPAPAVDLATELRVGLIADGSWRLRAERQSLSRAMRLWASEHVVASLLSYQPSPVM